MAKSRATGWIGGNVKPALKGVYQRDYRKARSDRDVGIAYCHWDGKRWGVYGPTPQSAQQFNNLSSAYQTLPWRGLAEDPSAATPSSANQGAGK